MIHIGVTNYISDATILGGNTNPSFPESNIQDDSLKRWQSESVIDTLTITFSARQIDLLVLHNINLDDATITGYLSGSPVFTHDLVSGDIDGIVILNAYIPVSGTVDTIEIEIDNSSSGSLPYIGFIWVGTKSSFDFEATQSFDNTTSSVEITDGGVAEQNPGYEYRSYSFTTAKYQSDYNSMRALFRPILQNFAIPRSFVIEGECLPTDVALGILDAPKIGYDIVDTKINGLRTAQFTFGMTEVLGGNSR